MSEKINFRIQPYINELKEAKLICFLLVCSYIFFIWIDIDILTKIVLIVCFTLFSIALIAYIPILALVDKKLNRQRDVYAKLDYADTEFTFLGDWWGHSKIGKQYDEPLHVDRYKFIIRDEKGKKLKVRNVSSAKRVKQIYHIFDQYNVDTVKVTYLPLSKILISIEVDFNSINIGNAKKKNELEKTILNINSQL